MMFDVRRKRALSLLWEKGYSWADAKTIAWIERRVDLNEVQRLPPWDHLATTPAYGPEDPACLCAAIRQLGRYRKENR